MRIVSLLPSATEIVFALGLGDELVGRTHECDYPLEALDVPVMTADKGAIAGASSREINDRVAASIHGGSSIYQLDLDALGRRTRRPDHHPGAVQRLRRQLSRGRRCGPPARWRQHGDQPRADVDRGHPEHDLDRRRHGRGRGRGSRTDRDCCASGWHGSRTASSSGGSTASRRAASCASSGSTHPSRPAIGCPSRFAAPAAGTCSAASGSRRARRRGTTCAMSIPSS